MSTAAFYQTPSIRIRLSLVILTFALIGTGMLGRSIWIQVIGDPRLESQAKKQFNSKFLIKPRRGLIVDRTGEPLAINLESSSLAGNPSKILQSRSTLHLLSRALGTPIPVLKKNLNPKKSFAWLERHITEDRLNRFKKAGIIFADGDMPEGLWIIKEMKRIYPHGELAAPILGTVNVDADGLEGVELWRDQTLRGKSASFDAIKDALGRPALLSDSNSAHTEDGQNVELSLDASLQYNVEASLLDSVQRTHSQSGLAIVMDSNTGEILALAQYPSFNPNQKSVGSNNRKLKALTDGYEPGSTMKPLLLSAALTAGMKSTDSLFGHHGKFVIQNRTISEAEAHEKFGFITLKKMIEVSSNIVAAELALKLGTERYLSVLRELGLGKKTGTQFPGEITGWLPPQGKSVQPLTLATMGFGQGLVVTPIQMLRAYAALSNGGFLVEPTLLKQNENQTSKKIPVLSTKVVKEVTQAMLGVTEGEQGTGKNARVDGFKIAGKTGTAQTVDSKTKRYSTSRYIASFIGFPVSTKQSFTILTLLDHPKGVYVASQTAAPLFSAVLKQVLSRFSIPATEPISQPLSEIQAQPQAPVEVVKATPENPSNTSEQNNAPEYPANLSEAATQILSEERTKPAAGHMINGSVMPSLSGLTPQEAMKALKEFTPSMQIHGFGTIKRQAPEAGAPLRMGEKIVLFLGE